MNSHIPVLLKEVIKILKPKDGVIIDGTIGLGGHAKEILKNSKVSVIGLDQDGEALELARKNLKDYEGRVALLQENFRDIKKVSISLKIQGEVKGILLDLGLSSYQLEQASRGFSFQKEGPLDMRMDKRNRPTAFEIVNTWSKEKIIPVLRNYGEERYARRIVEAIVIQRKKQRIQTTAELAELIKKSVPRKYGFSKIHPATRTFQALRIAVNDELSNLEKALRDAPEVLAPGGKIIVISFHSLEDRIVKRSFKDMAGKSLKILTKKPITPDEEETRNNPRSRSAKLRAAEKI